MCPVCAKDVPQICKECGEKDLYCVSCGKHHVYHFVRKFPDKIIYRAECGTVRTVYLDVDSIFDD